MKKKIKVWKPKTFKPVPKKITVQRTLNQKEYDTKWRKLSSSFRKKNVFCKHCLIEGVYTSEQLEVDHITPITSNPDLKYDVNNLQVLCKSHHAKKTYSETLSKE